MHVSKIAMALAVAMSSPCFARGLKQQSAPPVFVVDGKNVSASEAVVAVLNGKTAMKCTEMEAREGRSGITLKAKKAD